MKQIASHVCQRNVDVKYNFFNIPIKCRLLFTFERKIKEKSDNRPILPAVSDVNVNPRNSDGYL